MKWILLLFVLLTANICFAGQNIMHSLYLADRPNFDGEDDELSMIGEFGFLVASGNTNASTTTAKINTSQELTSWSYQIIGSALYKQSQQEVNGEDKNLASAQRLFLSGQLDHKLTEPNDRLFVYGEYENNRFSGFRYQAALAAGWTSRLWHDKQSEFKYSLGPGYAISEVEEDSSDEDAKGLIVRAAMEYKQKFSDHATFRQFISTEADQEFYKTKSETSLSTKLTGALAMKLSFVMNHDTSVGPDIEELDTEAAVTVVYQFF
jgi:putative salt-induced outer membrane protein YdiY